MNHIENWRIGKRQMDLKLNGFQFVLSHSVPITNGLSS